MQAQSVILSLNDVPQAVEPVFPHVLNTYASETNKTESVWRAVPDELLDFKRHEKTNSIRTILVYQLLSERRFFAAVGEGHRRLVAGIPALLRWFTTRKHLGVVAACAAYLPSSNAGADVAGWSIDTSRPFTGYPVMKWDETTPTFSV